MKIKLTILLFVISLSFNLAYAKIVPDDFPKFVIKNNGGESSGYLLGGVFSANPDVGNYNFILDDSGKPIVYQPANGLYCNMHPSGLISAPRMISGNKNIYKIYDNDFNLIDSVQMANGYYADSHDFKILPNGHCLLVSYNDVEIDMSKIVEEGHPNANVTQAIVQELDADKNPVFQWKSLDYIPITDSYSDLTAKNIDYIHMNSMFIDDNGDLILSCRSTSEILKVSRQTGEIIWRMGGKHNEFTFLNEHEENAPTYFCWQHDAKILHNGNLLFFDNGSTPSEETRDYSRIVEYELDEVNKTAKMVWEYRHEPDISTVNEGSVERLSNGNTVINWGGAVADGAPIMTEVDSVGNLVYEVSCTSQDIRAYIERVRWKVEDYTVRDTINLDFPMPPLIFKGDNSEEMGVSIQLKNTQFTENNEIRLELSDFAPLNPNFDGKSPSVFQKKILLERKNIQFIDAFLIFDIEQFSLFKNNEKLDPSKMSIYFSKGNENFLPLTTLYSESENAIVAKFTDFGEFIFCYPDVLSIPIAPKLNKPENRIILNQFESIKLNWSPIGFIQDFIVEIATDEEFQDIIETDSTIKTDYYDFKNPLENTEYFWRVKSVNDAGESEWSETWRFSTSEPYIKMIYPNGGEQLQKTATRHIIRWEKNTNDTVKIELYKNGEFVLVIKEKFFTSTNAYPWAISKSISLDTGYTVKVISLRDTALIAESENFSIIDSTIGVDETKNNSELSVSNYPNPAKNSTRFEFNLPVSGNAELSIFNIKGELVTNVFNKYFDSGEYYFDWNTSKLVSGEYYCRLIVAGQTVTGKMVIMK
ncbi:MAG: aryl-sulfate sulfotransferase [bacterium]